MNRLLVLLSALFLTSVGYAYDVWIATNTATADTTKALCLSNSLHGRRRAVVHSVSVNTGAAGTFTIYNSSAAASNPVAAIDTTAKSYHEFNVQLSTGITYTNSATANVTMMYICQ